MTATAAPTSIGHALNRAKRHAERLGQISLASAFAALLLPVSNSAIGMGLALGFAVAAVLASAGFLSVADSLDAARA